MKIQCNPDDPYFFFDDELHRYTYKGKHVASVTQVQKAAGLSKDYSDVDPKVLAHAAARGTAVHTAIEKLNLGNLEWPKVHEEIAPRVKAYQQFVDEHQWSHACSERKYYSRKWDYAGGMDEVGYVPKWKGVPGTHRVLIDYKTAYSVDEPGWKIQIQAYRNLWDENNPDLLIDHCGILWLNRDGKYEFIDADCPESWALFVYGRKILAWRQRHNR